MSKATSLVVDRLLNIDGTQTGTADTYNTTIKQEKGSGTIGSYLGLTTTQISNDIFEEIGE